MRDACHLWCQILDGSWQVAAWNLPLESLARGLPALAPSLGLFGAVMLARRGSSWSALTLLFESLAIVVVFHLLPPLFALGSYFLLWHSVRHSLQLVLRKP